MWSPDGNYIAYLSGDKLAVMTVDEGNVQALPLSVVSGGFGPVWSPDGSRLAYLVWDEEIAHGVPYVMRLDGSDIVKLGDAVVVGEPAWSPDSSRIAYLGFEESEDDKVLYVARPDGSEVLDLGKAASPPAWSPDGNRIAFFQQEKGFRLYTTNPDGTGRRLVLTLGRIGEWRPGALSWSPDGSTLLFASYYLSIYERYEQGPWHLVNIEDEKIVADFEGEIAEWSPDGSRIAVLANMCKRFGDGGFMEDCDPNDQDVLYTLARDGTDRQVLVRATNDRQSTKYERLNADFIRRDVPRRQAVCAVRYADNAGLSQDCETLLALRDKLGGDAFLNWHNSIPMARWQGVTIEGNPPRVHGLHIPIASGASPVLKGVLPSELGNLSELRWIDFSGNALTGELPAELGNLIKLERLVLYENNLTGSIPVTLGDLGALEGLYLGGNDLSGSIPAELGNLGKLEELDLKDNSLTGSIPAALDNLNEVKVLLLQDNGLTGSLPPELGNLENLKTLDVSGNDLTGCVPKVLSERTPNVFTDGLESCAE